MGTVARARAWFLFIAVGCAPAVVPGSLGGYADDDSDWVDPDEIAPFVDPPTEAPEAPGDPAWDGPAQPEHGQWAFTDPGELPTVRDRDGHLLPLRHTQVDARLQGWFADVVVTQTFRNDAEHPIEVVYAFPLPENAAVSRMRMVIGDRIIESDVRKRQEARQIYEQAKDDGHTAALLEQERPNIFTQSVANVAPGEDIDIEIEYLQTLSYDAGEYEFVFPMVIGPRFVPGEATGTKVGVGTSADTDKVPDASRISPPVVGEGTRRGDDFEIEVVAEVGRAIDEWSVPTHQVDARTDQGRLSLALTKAETLPNRDFVLRYSASDEIPTATLLLGPPHGGTGHYALVVHPPELDVDHLVGRREFVFVVDQSGSMSGLPLALAKETVRDALLHLRPVDTFNVVAFESGVQGLWTSPRPANATHLAEALGFVSGLTAGGGTMMANAVDAALGDPVADGHNRYVMFLTDGYIGNEAEIFAGAAALVKRISDRGQRARVFGVGIGSSPNRHLIAGLSKAGYGVPLEVGTREHGTRAVQAFARYVDAPVVEKLLVQAQGIALSDQHPAELGALFASHPVVALGEYAGGGDGVSVTVVGTRDGAPVQIPVTVLPADASDTTLDALWARAAVADLEPRLWSGPDAEAEAEITRLGLEHHLVTPFTSFVAVDRSRKVKGKARQVVEPTIVPEGVDADAAGATVYGVEGANVANPSFAGVSLAGASASREYSQVVESSAESAMMDSAPGDFHYARGVHGDDWPANPRLVIGRPEGAGAKSAGFRRAARSAREGIRRCYAASTYFDRDDRHTLTVRISFGRGGIVVELVGSIGDETTDACIRTALRAAAWPSLKSGSTVEISLHLSAH